ncbi:MAG TPA: discoidin domain-containing protein [Bacillota bacterium]|nr:discoidin domain-containing protein [Bacillota bacterium]
MCKDYLFRVLAFTIALAGWAQAADITSNLEGYWRFDEGSGQALNDLSGKGRHATLGDDDGVGADDPTWAAGDWAVWGGSALYFLQSHRVMTPPLFDVGTGEVSFAFFVKQTEVTEWQYIIGNKGDFDNNHFRVGFQSGTGQLRVYSEVDDDHRTMVASPEAYTGEWFYVVVTRSGAAGRMYINGSLVWTFATETGDIGNGGQRWVIGHCTSLARANLEGLKGYVDEVRVYSRALADEDVAALWAGLVSGGYEYAMIGGPADEEVDVAPRQVVLTWSAGDSAVTHDVYVGTSFDDVNEGTIGSPTYRGNQTDVTYALGDLALETTYYWRIDEVNDAAASSPWKGQVWSFTTEAVGSPLAGSLIGATASSADASDANATIDGRGLDAAGLHDIQTANMWLCAADDAEPWIRYDFDKTYKLHEMRVWNHNSDSETLLGRGIKDARIEVSVDGENWTEVHASYPFDRAPGAPGYAVGTVVPMNGAMAMAVRITALSNWSAYPEIFKQKGLSEVQFDYIPVWARQFAPASGASDVSADLTLSWRSGREATWHDVYIGPGAEELTLAGTVTGNSFDTSGLNLLLGRTYYWQVVEVNEAEGVSSWAGPVNQFSTEPIQVIDDFESYSNASPNQVFQNWQDGYGYPADAYLPAYNGNGTGSVLGHDIWTPGGTHYEGSIIERAIRYNGTQSAPFYYDGLSEIALVLDEPWDFTAHGVQGLVVHFWGEPGNTAAPLYVKINNSKVPYSGAAADLQYPGWTTWYVVLADLAGVDLTNVTSFTIGVESGQGILYIDDILLTPVAPEPAPPKASGSSIVLVSDGSNRVLKYQVDGLTWTPQGTFAEGDYAGEALNTPMGMCQDSQGRIYVGEQITGGGRILRFDASGNYIDTVVEKPADATSLAVRSEAVVLGPDGNVYVADMDVEQVWKTNISTKQTTIFVPKLFDGVRALDNPRGVSFGSNGSCFVSARQNNAVFEFNGSNGSFIRTFVEVNTPEDLLWVGDKLLVVYGGNGGGIAQYNADGSFDRQILNDGLGGPPRLISLGTVNGVTYAVGYNGNGVYRVESLGMIMKVTPDSGLGSLYHPARMLVLK